MPKWHDVLSLWKNGDGHLSKPLSVLAIPAASPLTIAFEPRLSASALTRNVAGSRECYFLHKTMGWMRERSRTHH